MEENAECYCRMVPLRKIIPGEYVRCIEKTTQQTSEIVREAYQFWKAFCLFQAENREEIVKFDRNIAKLVFSIIAFKKGTCYDETLEVGRLEEKSNYVDDIIRCFYVKHYQPLQKTKYVSPGKDILDTEITQMQTAIENHIKGHFYNYVKRLAFSTIPKIEKNARGKRVKLLKDLFENTLKSEAKYHELIKRFGKRIRKAKEKLYVDPQGCLKILYKINKVLEARKVKTFAWLPLRKSIIPASFSLSKTICDEFEKDKKTECKEGMWDRICESVRKMNIEPKQGFNLSSIRTAGSSASLIFTRKRKGRKPDPPEEQYIDDLTNEQLIELRSRSIVAADPNKGNLLQMLDMHGTRLRYTSMQRKFETQSGRFRKIRLEREAFVFSLSDEPISLKDAVIHMKKFNSRTTNFAVFMTYVKEKNLFAEQFKDFYFEMWHRKFRFNIKMNSNRSRDQFLNRFQALYGTPENTVLCVGDWEQRPGISFGKAPSMGIGIRNWFRKRGYPVYLVDECRTSLTCSACHFENEYNWLKRKDPRPWKKNKLQRVWGLSRCKNSLCRIVHNRDVNSSENILCICMSHLDLQGRPACFQRNHNCASRQGESNIMVSREDLAVNETEQS